MIDPQLIVVALVIGVAAIYILRRAVRTWAGSKNGGCGGGCGCSRTIEKMEVAGERLIPSDQLRVRRRD